MKMEQLSIFDIISEPFSTPLARPKKAISMFDSQEHELHPVEPWMSRLLPNGEYYIILDGMYMLVMCATRKKVPKELLFIHYEIDGQTYAATGVGICNDAEEYEDFSEEGECDEDFS